MNRLKRLMNVARREWDTFWATLAETAMKESHKIWNVRNWRGHTNPCPLSYCQFIFLYSFYIHHLFLYHVLV